jgi:G:T/U-mismatch repair DNA glycosylase
MITQHQYLDHYPIANNSKMLILGTIHPHDTARFQIPFFYGNRNSIWNLLSDAFSNELPKPITLEGVLSFLQQRKIAISDTVKQCRRSNPTALDSDLVPELLNIELLDQIRQSKIERILCTSAFGKNNAFKLFYEDLLGVKITPDIKANREVLLPPAAFGRTVLVKALYSPSGSANISLSKHPLYIEDKSKYAGSSRPVYDFKVDYYRQQFSM